jgi:hypothetical protein
MEQGYTGRRHVATTETPTIWDGEIPPPVLA